MIKSMWASVQGDPVFMRRVNGWFTILWILMIPVSIVTGWIHSVTYVAALSIWALVTGHWSTWQAARVEVTQQEEADERDQYPIEEKVVEAIVSKTDVAPAS
jgi:cobalamin biosynthesis protein CobD/CbiB